jgi:hypothetical protein
MPCWLCLAFTCLLNFAFTKKSLLRVLFTQMRKSEIQSSKAKFSAFKSIYQISTLSINFSRSKRHFEREGRARGRKVGANIRSEMKKKWFNELFSLWIIYVYIANGNEYKKRDEGREKHTKISWTIIEKFFERRFPSEKFSLLFMTHLMTCYYICLMIWLPLRWLIHRVVWTALNRPSGSILG